MPRSLSASTTEAKNTIRFRAGSGKTAEMCAGGPSLQQAFLTEAPVAVAAYDDMIMYPDIKCCSG